MGTERTSVLALQFFRCVPPGENRVLGSQRWKNPQFWGGLPVSVCGTSFKALNKALVGPCGSANPSDINISDINI